jgi:hypothetical protein
MTSIQKNMKRTTATTNSQDAGAPYRMVITPNAASARGEWKKPASSR